MNVDGIAHTPTTLATGRELQLLWISLLQRPWSSLAVVPTEPSASARDAANGLGEIGHYQDARQVEIVDVAGMAPGEGLRQAQVLGTRISTGKRVVILVDPVTVSLHGLPLVNAAQAALLVLRYGSTMESARATIALVGRDKILGAVALPPASGGSRGSA